MADKEPVVPTVGGYILMDGKSREIWRIDAAQDRVHFRNPANDPTPPLKKTGRPPSLDGNCRLSELQPITTPLGTVWFLPGRIEKRKPREGAVVLEHAVYELNGKGK